MQQEADALSGRFPLAHLLHAGAFMPARSCRRVHAGAFMPARSCRRL
jgi:hypothetical protein